MKYILGILKTALEELKRIIKLAHRVDSLGQLDMGDVADLGIVLKFKLRGTV